jgi:hypothetical protein
MNLMLEFGVALPPLLIFPCLAAGILLFNQIKKKLREKQIFCGLRVKGCWFRVGRKGIYKMLRWQGAGCNGFQTLSGKMVELNENCSIGNNRESI